MKIVKYTFVSVAVLSLLAGAAFAESQKREKWKPAGSEIGTAESAAPPSAALPNPLPAPPATIPLRYTVNYAVSCDPATEKGGTVITVINRRPYTALPTVNWVTVRFYNSYGVMVGQAGPLSIGSPDAPLVTGANNYIRTIGTAYEEGWTTPSIGTSLFPWIDAVAYDSSFSSIPCGYYGYAEILSSHPAIQVSAFGVSGTGNLTELPVRRAKLPTVGGH